MGNACCGDKDQSKGGQGLALRHRGSSGRSGSFKVIPENRRQTFAPNMKNFKNLKYVQDIEAIYDIGDELGKGSFGTVNKCVRVGQKKQCAIKMILKDSLNSNPMLPDLMISELAVLKTTSHPNIMNVQEILEDDEYYYIVTELLEGGELFDRLIE